MDLELFKVITQRLDQLEKAHNLLQIQTNVLQSCLEQHYPELPEDLNALYSEKLQEYLKESDSILLTGVDPSTADQTDPNDLLHS